MLNQTLFDSLGNYKVLVIGDIMLDNYVYGKCTRISPEAPVPVFEILSEEKMLGGAGNVLKNLKSFGVQTDILSIVGNDEDGNTLKELILEIGVPIESVFTSSKRCTTLKKRLIAQSQQLIRIDNENNNDIETEDENRIINFLNQKINEYDLVLFSDYAKGLLSKNLCSSIINLCNSNNIKVIIDPKGKYFDKYSNAFLIKPNLAEAELIMNQKLDSLDSLKKGAFILKEKYNLKKVVVTLGGDGIFYSDTDEKIIPTINTKIYDVSGAGDTVFASLAVCLLLGISLEDAVKFANVAASIVIQKFGSESTTIKEVLNKINNEKSN
jgi:D-beta-D-heptose 7-phosphate kinase/D-beta-D-heptose 1-phosphate adenosyltransferase